MGKSTNKDVLKHGKKIGKKNNKAPKGGLDFKYTEFSEKEELKEGTPRPFKPKHKTLISNLTLYQRICYLPVSV